MSAHCRTAHLSPMFLLTRFLIVLCCFPSLIAHVMDGEWGLYLARNVRAAKHLATKMQRICLHSPRKLEQITEMSAEWTGMLLGDSWMRCLQSAHSITRQIYQPVISWMCVFVKNNNLMGLRQVNDCGCGATGSRLNPNFYEVSQGWCIRRQENCCLLGAQLHGYGLRTPVASSSSPEGKVVWIFSFAEMSNMHSVTPS